MRAGQVPRFKGAGRRRRRERPKGGRVLMPMGSYPELSQLQPTKKPRQRQG
jgi:hypothetical protein